MKNFSNELKEKVRQNLRYMYFEEEEDVKDVEGSTWFTKLSEKV
jgi:hypothetical protein